MKFPSRWGWRVCRRIFKKGQTQHRLLYYKCLLPSDLAFVQATRRSVVRFIETWKDAGAHITCSVISYHRKRPFRCRNVSISRLISPNILEHIASENLLALCSMRLYVDVLQAIPRHVRLERLPRWCSQRTTSATEPPQPHQTILKMRLRNHIQ